jgi:hypothetical protein
MQRLDFNDVAFLTQLAGDCPPRTTALIKRILAGEQLREIGVVGDPRQRFSKTQILEALNNKPKLSERMLRS